MWTSERMNEWRLILCDLDSRFGLGVAAGSALEVIAKRL